MMFGQRRGSYIEERHNHERDDAFVWVVRLEEVDAQRMNRLDFELLQQYINGIAEIFRRSPSTHDEPIDGTCREVSDDEAARRTGLPPAVIAALNRGAL